MPLFLPSWFGLIWFGFAGLLIVDRLVLVYFSLLSPLLSLSFRCLFHLIIFNVTLLLSQNRYCSALMFFMFFNRSLGAMVVKRTRTRGTKYGRFISPSASRVRARQKQHEECQRVDEACACAAQLLLACS